MMRGPLLLVLLLLTVPSGVAAQTQKDLNAAAAASYRRSDSTLNAVYAQLLVKYRSDSVALRKLRAAERAWLVFRDAQVEASYPALAKEQYGSVYPMCVAGLLEQLTKARIEQLEAALNPHEGDVCAH